MTEAPLSVARSMAVAATDSDARVAAEAVIAEGGSALDAVMAGFFAAAGANAWAPLAPLVLAVAGAGAGVKFIDGRARQAGAGLLRPLRYTRPDEAPPLTRLSAPATATALALASAGDARRRLGHLAGAGVRTAKDSGADARARLVARMGDVGGLALYERWFLDELANAAPAIEGASLTVADLENVRASVEAPREPRFVADRAVLVPSWSHAATLTSAATTGRHAVVAADARGLLAAASWEQARDYVSLFGGEVLLPALSVPILKGVTRTAPGQPLSTPAPLAFVADRSLHATVVVVTTLAQLDDTMLAASIDAERIDGWSQDVASPASLGDEGQLLIALRGQTARSAPVALRLKR